MNARLMIVEDAKYLILAEEWMRDRYISYLEAKSGLAWIIEDEGRPLCAFGATEYWPGVYEVWFNLIEKVKIISQVRMAKRYIDQQAEMVGAWRLFALIKCDFEISKRFAEWLGFEYEGRLRKFNPDGSDAFMYAKIRS